MNENIKFLKFIAGTLVIFSLFSLVLRILFSIDEETERQLKEFYPNSIMPMWKYISSEIMSLFGGIWIIIKINRFPMETKNDSPALTELKAQKFASIVFIGTVLSMWIFTIGYATIRLYYFMAGATLISIGWFFWIRKLLNKKLWEESNSDKDEL